MDLYLFFVLSGRDLKPNQHQHARQRTTSETRHKLYIFISDTAQNAPQTEQRQPHQLYILTFLIYHRPITRHEKRPHPHTAVLFILCSVYATTDRTEQHGAIIIYLYILNDRSYSGRTQNAHRSTGTIIYNSISDTTENATSSGRESAHGLYYNSICYTSKPCIIHCRRIKTA